MRLPLPITEPEFQRLLRFYLACIASEDRRSLSKKLSALHQSLVSPWDSEEPLFHPDASEAVVELSLRSDQDVLSSRAVPGLAPERFFYGYPVFLGADGLLSPLFLTEIDVLHIGGHSFLIRRSERGRQRLNRHVFRRQHTQPEELQAIVDELEGEYRSFAARLRAAFATLDEPAGRFAPDRLEPYPGIDEPGNCWVNRPILFKADRSTHTHHLRHELQALAKYPRLFNALSATAAGVLAGIAPSLPGRTTARCRPPELLHVLPLNPDQEKAAHSGLGAALTVVTGPPGTGKSQMIVDLLASCALARRPVLFASRNNRAVNVVRDRLRAILGSDCDWTLRLGSRAVMNASRQEINQRLLTLRSKGVPPTSRSMAVKAIRRRIVAVRRRIEILERARLQCTMLEQNRRRARSLIDPSWLDSWTEEDCPSVDLAAVERLTAMADALAGRRWVGLWLGLKCAIAPAAVRRSIRGELASLTERLPSRVRADLDAIADQEADDPSSPLSNACEHLACLGRWRAAEDGCHRARLTLAADEPAEILHQRLEQLQQRRSELASDELRVEWTNRLATRAVSVRESLNRYFDLASRVKRKGGSGFFPALEQFSGTVRSMSADLPIWIVTNLSVRNALPLEPALFDLVVLDEASQCDIPSALPLLFRARRVLVVGDPRQLRHISTLSAIEEETLAAGHGVTARLAAWSYNERSLYALAESTLIEQGGEPVFLSEHYRSHPDIIEFSNQAFYQGRLVIRTPLSTLRARLEGEPVGLFWHDVRGAVSQSSRSALNELEMQAVLDLLDRWSDTGFLGRGTVDFGVVTPFRLQMERLAAAIRARPWWTQVKDRLTVGTAHQFQGDERDVMIFSPVVTRGMHSRLVRWVAETDQLLNVALTRARAALHVVGDLHACAASGGFLGDFATAVANRSRDEIPVVRCPRDGPPAAPLRRSRPVEARQFTRGVLHDD